MPRLPKFRPYEPDQPFLFPPDIREWLSKDDLVFFIHDVVAALDLKEVYAKYNADAGGQPPYHPRMMTALLLYAYCTGIYSSRKIEQATWHSLPFRVLTADQHPDHTTIALFRSTHLKALGKLFVQTLELCQKAGLVALGHVALDGTKVRANASKHKAMSYDRMEKAERELVEEVARLLAEAERVDAEEDAAFGKGRRGDELPEELRRRESRLRKIQEAKAALEAEARAKAAEEQKQFEEKKAKHEERGGRGRAPQPPSETVDPKAQRNFTDPDSRIMKHGATKSFEQCYNAQAAVDAKSQVIVAAYVTQEPNDKREIVPLVEAMTTNLKGDKPRRASADNGYYSEENIKYLENTGIDAHVATGRTKHGERVPAAPRGRIPAGLSTKERMARKLRTAKGRAVYRMRKAIVEPVFGQIKAARGFRQFLLRGFEKVSEEWSLVCAAHNLLKLHRYGGREAIRS
jgi:transposase